MNEELQQVGRLAFRHEGTMWNAYYALQYTMEGALLIGAIAFTAVRTNAERKELFMLMMRDVVADIIEQKTGQRPTWPEPARTAPEHERSGHA